MTNLEKCNAGIEYSYADEELIALKTEAIRQCEIFNAIDEREYVAQYRQLQQMLGAVGERVWIAKTFNCDRGKNIFIGDYFTGNHNLTILDMFSLRHEELLSRSGAFMQRFLKLLAKEGRTKHSVNFYADRLCVSPNHMSTLVRGESGLTVLQWINRALLREAKVLLHHTSLPISEVADTLGFATPSFFIRFFRQQTGCTPFQYRKQLHGND